MLPFVSITRKESPDWFILLDKIKAILEIEMGTNTDLATFLGVVQSRTSEWRLGMKEPKAQTVIKIQKWIAGKEAQIFSIPSKIQPYKSAIKKFSQEKL